MSSSDTQPLRFADRAAFRAWAEQQPSGRFEREDGRVIVMSAERAVHARVKARAWAALDRAIGQAGVPCEAFMDGMTVEVGPSTDYEPDVLVACGDRTPDTELVVATPLIIVEVLSPSTGYRGISAKLAGYFSVPSVRHYILLATDKRQAVHHRRNGDGPLATTTYDQGHIDLSPPGLRIDIADLYAGTDLAEGSLTPP